MGRRTSNQAPFCTNDFGAPIGCGIGKPALLIDANRPNRKMRRVLAALDRKARKQRLLVSVSGCLVKTLAGDRQK